ncbi:hypothetical protein HF984_08910 [Rothia terrae]|uniref:hypothetical protein n=1 Tax=Rothia terrae TaxID=396015 RepID=UPI0014465682|nr:hypothetical protein [Rothia terrae]NKZ34867.1 hypothetical protein [Rothia terrae]
MSDRNFDPNFPQGQFETSWARISLDFGPLGYELVEEVVEDTQNPADVIRQEIQQMISALKSVQGLPSESDIQKLDHVDLTAELFEKLCETKNVDELAALLDDDSEEVQTAQDVAEAHDQSEQMSEPPTVASADDSETELSEEERIDQELERRITEATSDDVVKELLLASVDMPQLMVYEADENHVEVYVLCTEADEELLTVEVNEKGELSQGAPFELFAAELIEKLSTRGGICADQQSYTVSAPVTEIGEEMTLNADAKVSALIEIEMGELALHIAQVALLNPIDAAPTDHGWTLVTSDAVSVLSLVSYLQRPCVVAAVTENSHHLSFIFPGSSSPVAAPEYDEGTWGDWMQKVVGVPGDDTESGVVIDLVWGVPKVLTRHVPQRSVALDTLWLLPGMLPEPLNFVRMNDEIDNLTWVYGLDDPTSKRLRNYVENYESDLGMESVLQLLGHTDDLAKVAEGRADISTFTGFKSFAPDMSTMKAIAESVTSYPSGDSALATAQRAAMDRPWILTVDGAAQLGASGVLAFIAARRRAQGNPARGTSFASAALASSGLTELIVARTFNRLQKLRAEQDAADDRANDKMLTKYLGEVTGETPTDSIRKALDSTAWGAKAHRKASQAKGKAKDGAKKYLRKFFGQ